MIFSLVKKVDGDICHMHLQNKEFICLRQFFEENWQNSRVLIVLDYGEETERVYHCGASSKDAGKKLCAINQIIETAIIHPVIDRLLSLPDKKYN